MKLKSGCLFWPQVNPPFEGYPPLRGDLTCDVAIIGGGITGALAAYYLTQAGIDTALVDRRDLGGGSTPASTGLLQYEIDTMLVDLMPKVGRDAAVRAYQVSRASLDAFEPLVADLGERCGLTARRSLYLATESGDAEKLKAECEARRAAGIAVDLLDEKDIRREFSFSRPAALWSEAAMEVDPYRLTQELFRCSVRRGLHAFGHTEVVRYESARAGVVLSTADGAILSARHVVFATGYETPEFVARDLCELKSTYALVTEPASSFEGWRDRCLVWESARPYFYLRTTPDGRAMMGGEDEEFADPARRDALIGLKAATLTAKFHAMFPAIRAHAACAWAGTFAETKDGLPYIGTLPEFPHGYFALGYGGNGITFSLIAAQIIRDQILGCPNPDANLFRFQR